MRKEREDTGEKRGAPPSAVAVWRGAIAMFGGDRVAAEAWLYQEAMGLGWRRPIDVMEQDAQQVIDLITRIDHGVYIYT